MRGGGVIGPFTLGATRAADYLEKDEADPKRAAAMDRVRNRKGVLIGAKFTGREEYACTGTGEFWAVMPPLDKAEARLQRVLIAAKGKK